MDKIKEFFSVISGNSGPIWLRILYFFYIAVAVLLVIFILVLIFKIKKRKKRMAAMKLEWKDRRRWAIGLPWTFDRYRLTAEKLLIITGFFNIKEEEIKLYRVIDLELSKSFGQRIFGMGTVVVKSSDKTMPQAILKNIKRPNEVKELISELVEKERLAKRVSSNEMVGMHGAPMDANGDGIPDAPEVDMSAHL